MRYVRNILRGRPRNGWLSGSRYGARLNRRNGCALRSLGLPFVFLRNLRMRSTAVGSFRRGPIGRRTRTLVISSVIEIPIGLVPPDRTDGDWFDQAARPALAPNCRPRRPVSRRPRQVGVGRSWRGLGRRLDVAPPPPVRVPIVVVWRSRSGCRADRLPKLKCGVELRF
jgi:hypothetical protein